MFLLLSLLPAFAFLCSDAFIPRTTQTRSPNTALRDARTKSAASAEPVWFFADKQVTNTVDDSTKAETRILGSQELLMAPRQYSIRQETFPSMNHVACAIVSATPDIDILCRAVDHVMQTHPLLQSIIVGDGEPDERVDLFQMVRKGDPNPMRFQVDSSLTAKEVLTIIDTNNDHGDLDSKWQAAFTRDLDNGSWCDVAAGPLWKLEWHRDQKSGKCAFVFAFNHAISDQSSVNRLVDQILRNVVALENGETLPLKPQSMPVTVEDSVLGLQQRWSDVQTDGVSLKTIQYVASKAAEGLKNPVILPDSSQTSTGNPLGLLRIISGQTAGGTDTDQRKSSVQFRSLSRHTMSALLLQCRENGVSVTHALTAAVTLTITDFIGKGSDKRNYKILQSLDMRRFGQQLDRGETVACMAGSMDLMHGPLHDKSGERVRAGKESKLFWKLAKEGKEQTTDFIANGGPEQAVRVFDFAMSIADLNNLVYLTAQSKDTKGRAYSAGIANIGVFESQSAFGDKGDTLKNTHGRYQIEDMFFATSHVQSGCLYQVSCMTIDGKLELTFHPVSPIVSEETTEKFADAFVELLEITAGSKCPVVVESTENAWALPGNILTTISAVVGIGSILSHTGAWIDFFRSVSQMKANIADPADFWAAINFWIFFAVGHPILQPILYLSDVLHGSPGPLVGNLVPVSFLAGNAVVIYAILKFKDLRNALNIALLAAFFSYIGAGLDGTAGLGDFNLALDDNYKGQIVKGCPAYEEVRQPSMGNFDINKYQGLWYEQKFHDWTQFKEVYDTSLDIKLTEGGKGWVDDFGVKGPAPDAASLSWDKSPVANGAHYFLFGRVDERDPPGILREKGFGVEFPNYIVDVKKDPKTGEYTESIQFQCLERGGVRVFEGINFMSRNKEMTDDELGAMHDRAEKAGMYPYGASPEQMHKVAQRPENAPLIDNNWQAMWRAIGLDKLLELLTESIEDGGRE